MSGFDELGPNRAALIHRGCREFSSGPDRTFSRLVDQITGDGWLLSARAQVGQVSYAIEMREVETWHNGARLSASEVTVRLWNHSIDPHCWGDQPLTLRLSDDLQFNGVISDDGTQFVRTSPSPEPPPAPALAYDQDALSKRGVGRDPRGS